VSSEQGWYVLRFCSIFSIDNAASFFYTVLANGVDQRGRCIRHIGKELDYGPFVEKDTTAVLDAFVCEDGAVDYGQFVRFLRKEVFHWTAEEFGELFGKASRGKHYSR
jgi:hypothetical protein